ncbi:phage tail protein I [Enterovibrio nigricans]|uniref:Phage tail protein, P2 protein I family n=1 Tax=Enterovibrio nigricans DSM 22720 TaxID=1121868 RepID=A0A1T4UVP0_9GAMM|nr:phage tail protein I [Enterovibrio nigricans]PKF50929.1 phage tail protein I [Enterovibrio nigricans]SKA56685.1 phage tail protein, P2 protein I family [Enterovibrio nigricans DSM 22720]
MLPSILRKDIRYRALSELSQEEMNSLRESIRGLQVLDIASVHESYLPWLAWWFRVDIWDDTWSIEKKRQVVADGLVLFKYKGTVWAVKRALDLVGYNSHLEIWHQAIPQGQPGTFSIAVEQKQGGGFDQQDYTNIVRLIESNKQGSQTWSLVVKNDAVTGGIYPVAHCRARQRVTTRNWPQNPTSQGGVYYAAQTIIRNRMTITNKV